jgi:signal peptidase I
MWKKDHVQTAIALAAIIGIVFGLWFGSQLVLNTRIFPALAVVSGSMCISYDGSCDGWLAVSQPFDRTLHRGDLIVIQGVDPKTLNTNYPNSDVIVFYSPNNPTELIVHRIIGTTIVNGTIYFQTKGDGNGNPWPQTPESSLDPWDSNSPAGVPQSMVVGKVVMRIPWVGWMPILMQKAGANGSIVLPIILILIVLLIAVQFGDLLIKRRKSSTVKHKLGTD